MASKTYSVDSLVAKDAAYQGPNNPFEVGSRRHRLYTKWRAHHDRMEEHLTDVAAAYGYAWPLPGMQPRHPGSKES